MLTVKLKVNILETAKIVELYQNNKEELKMFIQLVKVPCKSGEGILRDKWYLPLELTWIATYLNQFGHKVEIIDGQWMSVEEIIACLRAPIVGLGFNIYSAGHLFELAQAAKDKGALVVVGGQAATNLAVQLLNGVGSIDAVICHDGENALLQIAKKLERGQHPFRGTPNTIYWERGEIIFNPNENVLITDVPIPDRRIGGIDPEKYITSFLATNTSPGFTGQRVTNAHTKKGCPRRCIFCARTDKTLRARSPQQALDEYRYLVEEFEVDHILDHSDTWACGENWLKEFHHLYEDIGGLDTQLGAFVDLRDVTVSAVEVLKAIGMKVALVGIESGSEEVLKVNWKYMPQIEILERVSMLTEAGIQVEASFILGMVGETQKSLRETRSLVDIFQGNKLVKTYASIMMPLPGTGLWEIFLNDPGMREKYGDQYLLGIEELRQDYLVRCCNFGVADPYSFLIDQRAEILAAENLPLGEYIR